MKRQDEKFCYVKTNDKITFEVSKKGWDMKVGDLIVFYYNNSYRLARVVEKSIDEVQITNGQGYVVNIVDDKIEHLKSKKETLQKELCRLYKIVGNLLVDKLENQDIDSTKAEAEYLNLKKELSNVEQEINDWLAL